jgi:hypothetical protein
VKNQGGFGCRGGGDDWVVWRFLLKREMGWIGVLGLVDWGGLFGVIRWIGLYFGFNKT